MSELPQNDQARKVEVATDNNPVGFNGLADRFIKRSKSEGLTPLLQRDLLEGFLDSVEQSAVNGDILSSDGEPYDLEQIKAQFSEAVDLMNHPADGEDLLRRIPRAHGLRSAIESLLTTESVASTVANVLTERYGMKPEQSELGERITSPQSAKELGHQALEGTVEQPDVFDSLSESVKREILDLRTAEGNRAMSERNKDFSQAARDKERAFTLRQGLSEEARRHLGY